MTLIFVLSGSGPLDVRIKRLAGQRDDLQDTVRRLKLDLEEERGRASLARGAADLEELRRRKGKKMRLLKLFFKLVLSEKPRSYLKITSLGFLNQTRRLQHLRPMFKDLKAKWSDTRKLQKRRNSTKRTLNQIGEKCNVN